MRIRRLSDLGASRTKSVHRRPRRPVRLARRARRVRPLGCPGGRSAIAAGQIPYRLLPAAKRRAQSAVHALPARLEKNLRRRSLHDLHQVQVMNALQKVAIIGAGPAGLTAAYLLAKRGVPVTVLESDPHYVGGLSRTVQYKGFHFDIGGHRFFSKSRQVEDFWSEILPPRIC